MAMRTWAMKVDFVHDTNFQRIFSALDKKMHGFAGEKRLVIKDIHDDLFQLLGDSILIVRKVRFDFS